MVNMWLFIVLTNEFELKNYKLSNLKNQIILILSSIQFSKYLYHFTLYKRTMNKKRQTNKQRKRERKRGKRGKKRLVFQDENYMPL